MEDGPTWATRLRRERHARGWSQRDTVRAMRSRAGRPLPDEATLLRTWKRWESGRHLPDGFYRSLIATTFGTVTGALFPHAGRPAPTPATLSSDSLALLARPRSSDIGRTTLDELRVRADRLCSDYRHLPAPQLRTDGVLWLRRITGMLDRRLTLAQHREVLGVVAAHRGDADAACRYGIQALSGPRRSLPSLLMVAGELERTLRRRYPDARATREFTARLADLRHPGGGGGGR